MRGWRLAGLLVAAFALRLAYGLTSEFWMEDERQIYLIGLKYFATGAWPYFGPDVVYTQTQVPGALQGLLIGLPLYLAPYPEAPFVLLNLLSLGALWLLAWYIDRRVPGIPAWVLWPVVFLSPWTLNFSTHVTNPSYVLTGGVLFFVGAFEALPMLRIGALSRPAAFFAMGFALLWTAQLHMSFPLLLPFAAAALAATALEGARPAIRASLWFTAGAVLSGATLVPTLVHHGGDAAGASANVTFNAASLLLLPDIAARYFSFASFELPRFLGPNTATRMRFLGEHPWAAPFAVFAGLIGLLQPFVLLAGLFWRNPGGRAWPAVRAVTAATLLLVYLSFVFSVKDPASHTFYVTLPVVMIYAMYCWRPLLAYRPVRIIAAALLVSGFVTHVAMAVDGWGSRSLYVDRPLVARAIRERDDRLLGERRPVIWEAERAARPGT
jgi:hypothetical protein